MNLYKPFYEDPSHSLIDIGLALHVSRIYGCAEFTVPEEHINIGFKFAAELRVNELRRRFGNLNALA